jgi:hypothetical protein
MAPIYLARRDSVERSTRQLAATRVGELQVTALDVGMDKAIHHSERFTNGPQDVRGCN